MAFLHGIDVVERTGGAAPIRAAPTGVIGLVGTAGKGPVNLPTLIAGRRSEGAELFGAEGTIPDALDAIFAQAGAVVVVVNVFDPAARVAVDEADYAFTGDTLDLPGTDVSDVVVKNKAGDTTYVDGTDYDIDAATGVITRKGNKLAAGAEAKVAYKRAAELDDASAADIAGDAGTLTGTPTGVHALIAGESVVGHAPRVLIAPGFADQVVVGNGLVAAANRLRGIAVLDGPSTTDAEATTYRDEFDARRGYLVEPGVQVADANGDIVDRPASGYVAGLIARIDTEEGFWVSPSNRVLSGVVGTSRPIDFTLGEQASRANLLNEKHVATIVRQNGYRLWGSRTLSADTTWAFLSVVRIADALAINLFRSHLWAVDRNIGPTYLEDVAAGVNAYIAELVGLGALLGGACRPSPELNTPATLAAGQVCFDIDFTPPAPAERVTFRTRLVQDDLVEALP